MTIVFIGCVKTKAKGIKKAEEKYISQTFKKELEYAKKITNRKNIYILSAKYGIITLDEMIDDYNLTLNNFTTIERKIWSKKIIEKAKEYNIDKNSKIIFLCGKKYSEFLQKYYKNWESPMNGLSMGYKLKWLNENL